MGLWSKYTTTFHNFCESTWMLDHPNDTEKRTREELINYALPKIFDFIYPIWDSNYKINLEYMIVNHYYLDEVAFETWGQFKLMLESWMNENMPRFNILYEAGKSIGDIYTVGYMKTDEYHGTDQRGTSNTGTQKNEVERTNTGMQVYDESKNNTGTQNTKGTVADTGKQIIDDDGSINKWESNRDIAEGDNFQADEYTSEATLTDGTETNTRTRTDDLLRTNDSTRTDNLKETSKNQRTDDLQENVDTTRTDNLNKNEKGRDDNKRTIQMVYDVQNKVKIYGQLWEYYKNVDSEIIQGLGRLFLGVW